MRKNFSFFFQKETYQFEVVVDVVRKMIERLDDRKISEKFRQLKDGYELDLDMLYNLNVYVGVI